MKEKIKTISKYAMNILAFINAILVGLSPIWGWKLDKITDSIVVLVGLIGAYLVSGKIFGDKEEEQDIEIEFENEPEVDYEVEEK
jgi:hypothetical protein